MNYRDGDYVWTPEDLADPKAGDQDSWVQGVVRGDELLDVPLGDRAWNVELLTGWRKGIVVTRRKSHLAPNRMIPTKVVAWSSFAERMRAKRAGA